MKEDNQLDNLNPIMEINIPEKKEDKEIISTDEMIVFYNEIIGMIREDRKEVSSLLDNFVNMVINEGDASTASKEAMVNLVKIKTDLANNMSKVFELLARMKAKNSASPEVGKTNK
jgi:hypothetical protein